MIHAPSGIAQAEANVRVWVGTCPMQLWPQLAMDPRPSKSSRPRTAQNDVRWALARHWAIEPHSLWPRAVTSTFPVRAATHTRSSFCLVFDGHRGFRIVLSCAVTSACIEPASVFAACGSVQTGPAAICDFGSSGWSSRKGIKWHVEFFFSPYSDGGGGIAKHGV